MDQLLNQIKRSAIEHKSFLLYGSISVFVTVIDIIVCRICELFASVVLANTIGVVTGFTIQYFLTAKHVYKTKGIKSFFIFFSTFLFNLLMADGIVYFCRVFVFNHSSNNAAFLISKGISIVLPFLITYFIRKKLMPYTEKGEENE